MASVTDSDALVAVDHVQLRDVLGPAGVVEAEVGLLGDPRHRGDDPDGVEADGRLRGEHDGAGSVEDGVRHVGRLGAGRHRRLDHGLQHLRGGDGGATAGDAAPDDVLLQMWQVLDRELDAQVAPRHHDGVGGVDDRIDVLHGGSRLDLGDQQRSARRCRRCPGLRRSSGPRTNDNADEVHARLDEGLGVAEVPLGGSVEAEPVRRGCRSRAARATTRRGAPDRAARPRRAPTGSR